MPNTQKNNCYSTLVLAATYMYVRSVGVLRRMPSRAAECFYNSAALVTYQPGKLDLTVSNPIQAFFSLDNG